MFGMKHAITMAIHFNNKTKGINIMKLIRYNPSGINPPNEIDSLFENVFADFGRIPIFNRDAFNRLARNEPAVDFYEDADNYYARFELPGVKKGDIQLNLERNLLSLKGDRKEKIADGEKSSSFSRSISLPEEVDSEKVSAKLQDGLLTITLPRAEAGKARQISIK